MARFLRSYPCRSLPEPILMVSENLKGLVILSAIVAYFISEEDLAMISDYVVYVAAVLLGFVAVDRLLGLSKFSGIREFSSEIRAPQ